MNAVTAGVPAATSDAVGTMAVTVVALTYVVASDDPASFATVVAMKFVPVSVMTVSVSPALAVVGEIDASVGIGLSPGAGPACPANAGIAILSFCRTRYSRPRKAQLCVSPGAPTRELVS